MLVDEASPKFHTNELVPKLPELVFVVAIVLEQTDDVLVNATFGLGKIVTTMVELSLVLQARGLTTTKDTEYVPGFV